MISKTTAIIIIVFLVLYSLRDKFPFNIVWRIVQLFFAIWLCVFLWKFFVRAGIIY